MGERATDGILERPEVLGQDAIFSVLFVSSLLSDGKMEDVDILAGLEDWSGGWALSLGSLSLSARAGCLKERVMQPWETCLLISNMSRRGW